jgi:hypothetical protein
MVATPLMIINFVVNIQMTWVNYSIANNKRSLTKEYVFSFLIS